MDPKATILIVDDDPSNVDMLSQELDDEGYTVLSAFDGEEALIKVQDHQPELILLDVMMPKVDGFTVCRILKGSSRTMFIPVIMLTALRGHKERIRGIDAGADDFISKPFDRDELLAKIRSLLRQKSYHDEQERAMREQLQSTRKDLEQARLELAEAQQRIQMLERAKKQLSKFVPLLVRDMVEIDPEVFDLEKEERDATVLFLDIGGYSSMCECLDHHMVNFLVEKYFSEFLDDIRRGNGEINETAGDGLMIIFQDEDPVRHARTAASTAISIHYKTQKVNAELRLKHKPTVVNVGINSGTVLLGTTKFEGLTSDRWTFTASGLTTIIAARIADLATGGKILLGAETVKRLGDEYLTEPFGEHRLKNIAQPVPIFQLIT
jgi:DNA-binding response OmpR family regulator